MKALWQLHIFFMHLTTIIMKKSVKDIPLDGLRLKTERSQHSVVNIRFNLFLVGVNHSKLSSMLILSLQRPFLNLFLLSFLSKGSFHCQRTDHVFASTFCVRSNFSLSHYVLNIILSWALIDTPGQ